MNLCLRKWQARAKMNAETILERTTIRPRLWNASGWGTIGLVLKEHVNSHYRTSFYQMHQIRVIITILSFTASWNWNIFHSILMHLHYCNGILAGGRPARSSGYGGPSRLWTAPSATDLLAICEIRCAGSRSRTGSYSRFSCNSVWWGGHIVSSQALDRPFGTVFLWKYVDYFSERDSSIKKHFQLWLNCLGLQLLKYSHVLARLRG